jgi:phenylacetate-coenzyme A ligase PaaK-like adenylate-forming protein
MRWHFSEKTGCPFWLSRARTLDFDPVRQITSFQDLRLFPNVAGELRGVRPADLIPRGYGDAPRLVGVYESGGTTGAPKNVVLLQDWLDRSLEWTSSRLDLAGFPRGADWLVAAPTGPHIFGRIAMELPLRRGGVGCTVDLDPRWVKRSIGEGRPEEAERYTGHIVDQITALLRQMDGAVLVITPPLLERLVDRDDRLELVRDRVRAIMWGGTHLDPDTRDLLRDEVLPDVLMYGMYGSSMILGGTVERPAVLGEDRCVFDSFSPYTTLSVVDPDTGVEVADGVRGQVLMHHVSPSFLLPNNLERDCAVRVAAPQ